MSDDLPEATARTGRARWCLVVVGSLCTALGMAGAFLPLLPTTPFLLLALACFERSSPALHRRLLENRMFGPYLAQWKRDRSVPREAKRKAHVLVVLMFALSIALVDATWLRGVLAGVGVALIGFLAWLPTTRAAESTTSPDDRLVEARRETRDESGEQDGVDRLPRAR
jgi:uncharacterized membrane protein YbaN (DUF454 family)